MSPCATAISAASTAVRPPVHAMTASATGLAAISQKSRHIRYTPAATIVAAWISALTGVGPSIASGSQTCSGNCALLPTAPQNTSSAAAVVTAVPAPATGQRPARVAKSRLPASDQTSRIPRRKPKSPTRLVSSAFFAASAAAGRSNQKPISRYDDRPTSSQNRNIWTKFVASTMPSIEKVNSERPAK